MPRGSSFKTVESIARTLPDVEVTTTYGQPALKVRGKMFACIAAHKSAEPNTLVVRIDFFERDLRVANEPEIYYLKPHYVDYACVLTRLSRIDDAALRELLESGWRFINKKQKTKAARPRGSR